MAAQRKYDTKCDDGQGEGLSDCAGPSQVLAQEHFPSRHWGICQVQSCDDKKKSKRICPGGFRSTFTVSQYDIAVH